MPDLFAKAQPVEVAHRYMGLFLSAEHRKRPKWLLGWYIAFVVLFLLRALGAALRFSFIEMT